jgi:serine protease DegS
VKIFRRYILQPIILGLLVGFGAIIIVPELRYSFGQQVAHFFQLNDTQTLSYSRAVGRAAPAVVNISSSKKINAPRNPLFDDPLFRHFFNSSDVPKQQRMSSALGSGVIINKEGYLLTNYHVVEDAEDIFVTLYDGRLLKAKLIGSDEPTDLSVLKIDNDKIQTIILGDPNSAFIGDIVLAIGNPFNVGQTVTQGIISATGRYGLGLNVYENFIQTDAAINPGNSGGALIDINGRLLGINTAILDRKNNSSSTGIGFAIPADIAVNVMNDIITSGEAIRGWLGIEARPISQNIINNFSAGSINGVLITIAYPDGPADLAGIKAGDILTHINDKPVGNGRDAMNLIAQVRPNDKVQLTAIRDNKTLKLSAVAAKRPKEI